MIKSTSYGFSPCLTVCIHICILQKERESVYVTMIIVHTSRKTLLSMTAICFLVIVIGICGLVDMFLLS